MLVGNKAFRRWLIGLAAGLLLAGCHASPSASVSIPTATVSPPAPAVNSEPTATPLTNDDPLTFSGNGDQQTPVFELRGGSYSVAWKGTAAPSGIGCFLYGYLMAPSSDLYVQTLSQSAIDGQDNSGKTEWSDIRGGQYYLKISSTCTPWSFAMVPQGGDPEAALPQTQASESSTSAALQNWQLTPIMFEEVPPSVVFDDYGLTRQQNQPGKFVRATFSLTNLQERGASVTGADFELADSSEQTYHSDFQMRQVQGSTSQPFDGSTIGPGASVLLMLIFDVAPDANDLMLRVRSR